MNCYSQLRRFGLSWKLAVGSRGKSTSNPQCILITIIDIAHLSLDRRSLIELDPSLDLCAHAQWTYNLVSELGTALSFSLKIELINSE